MNSSILLKAYNYYNDCMLISTAKIRKLPNGKYKILSEKGKSLGVYDSKIKAKNRLKQIEFFKYKNNANDFKVINLNKLEEFSYSAFMRKLRQEASKQQVLYFLKLFKEEMDSSIKNKLQKPEKIALQKAVLKFNKKYKISLPKKILKNAAITELGDALQISKYLASIIKLTISRMAKESRPKAISRLIEKFKNINVSEVANKKMPASAAIGQSISFVKNILFNHDATFVHNVLKNLVILLSNDSNYADVNNADIVSNQREYRYDNKDSYLNDANRSSFAPYLDSSRVYPDKVVYPSLSEQSPTRENYKQKKNISDNIIMPNVGLYDNSGPIKGVGPVESPGGLIYN